MQARQSHKERLCLTYLARADIVPDFPPVKKVSGLVDEVHFLSFSTPPSGLISHACLLLPTQSLVHSRPVFLFVFRASSPRCCTTVHQTPTRS
jgi:hypothetical protein